MGSPDKSGLKKEFRGYKQTDKPALQTKGRHFFFPMKSQVINIPGFVGHTASAAAGQLCRCRTAAADTRGGGRPCPLRPGSRARAGAGAPTPLQRNGPCLEPQRSLSCAPQPCGTRRKHSEVCQGGHRQPGTADARWGPCLGLPVAPRGPPVQELRRQARVAPAPSSRGLCIGHLPAVPGRQARPALSKASPRGPGTWAPTSSHKPGQRCCCVFDDRN